MKIIKFEMKNMCVSHLKDFEASKRISPIDKMNESFQKSVHLLKSQQFNGEISYFREEQLSIELDCISKIDNFFY